jgi:hypothetical protein
MRTISIMIRLSLVLALALAGCAESSESESASPAAKAPPPPPPPPLPTPPRGSNVAAEPEPTDSIPNIPGMPDEAMKAMQELGKLGSAQALMGPVVSFRDLAGFLPDELAGFQAKDEVDGKTTSMNGMQLTEVSRRYARDGETLRIKIVDTSLLPMLRAGFAMVQMVQEDSTRGYKKGGSYKGHPGIAEWKKARKQSELRVLAAQRFMIEVELQKSSEGAAEKVFDALDVKGIVASASKARDNAAAPPQTP